MIWLATIQCKVILTVSKTILVSKNIQRICSIASQSTAKCTTSMSLSSNTVTAIQWETQQQKQYTLHVQRTVILNSVIEKCTVKPTEVESTPQYKKKKKCFLHMAVWSPSYGLVKIIKMIEASTLRLNARRCTSEQWLPNLLENFGCHTIQLKFNVQCSMLKVPNVTDFFSINSRL